MIYKPATLKKQISRDKILTLINFDVLSNKYQKVESTLKNFNAVDDIEKCKVTTLYATNSWLKGNTKEALQHLLSFPKLKIDKEFLFADEKFKNDATFSNLYSMARMYALLKKPEMAFSFLKKALDAGFLYDQVLKNDAVWNFITTKQWNALFEKYELGTNYSNVENFISAMSYRIPDQGEE